MTMPLDEYSSMVSKVADESENVISGRFRPYR